MILERGKGDNGFDRDRQDTQDDRCSQSCISCTTLRSSSLRSTSASLSNVVPLSGRRGFTLIEVLIAVGVFTVAFGGVFALLATGAESRRRAEDGTEASLIATSLVAEARARFRGDGPLQPVSGRPWPTNPRYTFDLDYIQLDKAGDEVFMRVRVRWLRGGSTRSIDFDTILLRKLD